LNFGVTDILLPMSKLQLSRASSVYCASYVISFIGYWALGAISLNIPSSFFVSISTLLSNVYGAIGFSWIPGLGEILGVLLFWSLVMNILRRAIESIALGWPRFKEHDRATVAYSLLRMAFYLSFIFIAFGALGKNIETLPQGMAVGYTAVMIYIFGLLINVVDDGLSSVVAHFYGKTK
jgi:hypothetical protein